MLYQIGPIGWKLYAADGDSISYSGAPYDVFTAERPANNLSSLPLVIHRGMPVPPDVMPLFRAGKNWAVWDEGETLFFGVGLDSRLMRRACRVDRGLCTGDLWIGDDSLDGPLRYPLDQLLAWGMLSQCNGVLLHAAAAVDRGGVGYVLAGRSGAGKSTLSEFCHEAGWDILNDDRVIVYPDTESGQWLMSGTPWHGTGHFAKNRTVPLGGVYLLQQDRENVAEDISLQAARYALMDVAGIAWFEEMWSQQALDALARLTQEVPVRRLRFTRSPEAVEALKG